MPDVLFDSGNYKLKPAARERLARISGIVLAYPDLKLEIEGHTDSIGSDEFNQTLSEKRAAHGARLSGRQRRFHQQRIRARTG